MSLLEGSGQRSKMLGKRKQLIEATYDKLLEAITPSVLFLGKLRTGKVISKEFQDKIRVREPALAGQSYPSLNLTKMATNYASHILVLNDQHFRL